MDWFILVFQSTQCCKLGKILLVFLTIVMVSSVFVTINFNSLEKNYLQNLK